MYQHTQSGPIGWLLWVLAGVELVVAWMMRDQLWISIMVFAVAGLFVALACSFRTLTIQDEGDFLGVRFGPLPLFYKRIAYDKIDHIERGQTRWIDGWGIHWVPGRGWTYNLWGFESVTLKMGRKTVRLGTDDAEGLFKILEAKVRRDS